MTNTELVTATPNVDDVLSTFNDAEWEIFNELRTLVSSKFDEDAQWYYQFGVRLCQIYKAAQKNRELYGARLIERLAVALPLTTKSPTILYNAMRVVEVWPTKTAFNQMLKLRGQNGARLSWTHLVHLATIEDANTRELLAKTVLEDGMSGRELAMAIRKLYEKPDRPQIENRGRKPRKPKSLVAWLSHVEHVSSQFTRLCQRSWLDEEAKLTVLVEKTEDVILEPKVLQRVQDLLTQLDSLSQLVQQLKTDVNRGAQLMQRKLKIVDAEDMEVIRVERDEEEDESDESDYVPVTRSVPRKKKKVSKHRKRSG